MKTCNCINEVDEKFREENIRLTGYALMMPGFRPVATIRTDWVKRADAPKGKKNSPPAMMATFCPFCGVKYADPEPAKVAAHPAGCVCPECWPV